MNSKNNDKDKALRIVEALSGVDAELIERSERRVKSGNGTAANRRNSTAIVILTRYLAACAVFICVCVGAFGVYLTAWRDGSAPGYKEKTGDSAGAGTYFAEDSGKEETEMSAEAGEGTDEAVKVPQTSDGTGVKTENQKSGGETESIVTDDIGISSQNSSAAQTNEQDRNMMKESIQELLTEKPMQQDSRAAVTLSDAEKTENAGEHIPGIIPERFVLESCRRSNEELNYHDVILRWTDSDSYINVYITDYYLVMDGMYVLPDYMRYSGVTNEAVGQLCTEDNGRTSFGMNIMFEDGVWAEVTVDADMTAEEIYKMIVSMGTVMVCE